MQDAMCHRKQKGRVGSRFDRYPFCRDGAGHRKMRLHLYALEAAQRQQRVELLGHPPLRQGRDRADRAQHRPVDGSGQHEGEQPNARAARAHAGHHDRRGSRDVRLGPVLAPPGRRVYSHA